ncbi:MAG: protein kinase [Cystobacterineae bacterium]|nr:protein kinase [Cystobacterineae bacterium]
MPEKPHNDKTQPRVDPYVGVTLDGRFRIVHLVGAGGMGRVYRAIQMGLNRAVALKILDPPHGSGVTDSLRQRFLAEASMTANLHHPNTVTVIDYGATPNDTLYIAFEFLEGRTLAQVLATEGALPWPRVLHIAQQIARSLRQAHSMGVVHRDLKPANIMLLDVDSDTDLVKVLDFGLVKAFTNHRIPNMGHDVTQAGMLVGSPTYMSPEQGQSCQANPRSDLYALGIVMYESLTGAPPFQGGSPIEVILKHINEPVPPIHLAPHLPPLPPEVENLVMGCLAKRPEERPNSMDEFLLATQALFASASTLSPGGSSPYLPNVDAHTPSPSPFVPPPLPPRIPTPHPLGETTNPSGQHLRVPTTPPTDASPNQPRSTLSFSSPGQPSFPPPQTTHKAAWLIAFVASALCIALFFFLYPHFHKSTPLQHLDDLPPISMPPVIQKYNAPEELFSQRISSIPAGALVFLDGAFKGITPLELQLPTSQENQSASWKLELEGFQNLEFESPLGTPIEKQLRPLPRPRAPRARPPPPPPPPAANTPLENIPSMEFDSPSMDIGEQAAPLP